MEDLKRNFDHEFSKTQPKKSDEDHVQQSRQQYQRLEMAPIANQDSAKNNRPRISNQSSARESGTKRASHSLVPSEVRDGADNAIIGLPRGGQLKESPQRKSQGDWSNNSRSLGQIPGDWQVIEHPAGSPPPKPPKPPALYSQALQRSKQDSQDDINVRRQGENYRQEDMESPGLRQKSKEVESLKKQLAQVNEHVKQAERASHHLSLQLQQHLGECNVNHGPRSIAEGNDAVGEAIDNLERENRKLKAELEDARSHIFSLQPYRKDLTPEEVGTVITNSPSAFTCETGSNNGYTNSPTHFMLWALSSST